MTENHRYELYRLLVNSLRLKLQPHTLVSEPKKTLAETINEYHVRTANGERLIWLAVGSAWTGINIGGHEPMRLATGSSIPASEDNVLTDLVIPALPFGTNKTVTHITRRERAGNSSVEIVETLFKMIQGIGRLVRREGLPQNRRIHILDARLVDGTLRNMKGAINQIVGR